MKKSVSCCKCGGKYIDENIDLLAETENDNVIFNAHCEPCNLDSFVTVHMDAQRGGNVVRLGTAPRMGQITQDEVLDMHNFLKGFDGNFSALEKDQTQNK